MMKHRYAQDVEQIRVALHKGRASVMVGAGFSFNAKSQYTTTKHFPSWVQLAESLISRLYPNDKKARSRALKRTGATSGILRLAQEYQAAFGRTVLLNHLQEMLPDMEYEPGQLHSKLLELPWVDVFTTNYDTLLDRASRPLRGRRYEVVRYLSDLPLKCPPRIVKLHGTLPDLKDCIFTEEDYRQYPERFAPFVAEVQAAMAKSHMCLVGFSGDDPNFLAWSGWVRDRLGESTLPIYFWTFDDLATFQVRMLEQRAVIPLPLHEITHCDDRRKALHEFIKLLAKPPCSPRPAWCLPPAPDEEEVDQQQLRCPAKPSKDEWWDGALSWRRDRSSYPGWIVPHVKAIAALWKDTEKWAICAASDPPELAELEPPQCVLVLYELLWRIRRAVYPTFDKIATNTFPNACKRYLLWRAEHKEHVVRMGDSHRTISPTMADLDYAAMDLQLECLRHAREIGSFGHFKTIRSQLDECGLVPPAERRDYVKHFKAYETALAMSASWETSDLATLLRDWDTSKAPLWALRRAGLLIETGEQEAARKILNETLESLRAIDCEGSHETWSIEAWVIHNLEMLRLSGSFLSREAESGGRKNQTIEHSTSNEDRRGLALSDPKEPRNGENGISRDDDTEQKKSLRWLSTQGCDPSEIMNWLAEQNQQAYKRPNAQTRNKVFETRRWTSTLHFDSDNFNRRMVAAYRTLRLIEDVGLPLRARGMGTRAASLAQEAVAFLASEEAPEAAGFVLRSRRKNMIKTWFTRRRIATMDDEQIRQLLDASMDWVDRFAKNPELLRTNSDETHRLSEGIELLSRVAIRAKNETQTRLVQLVMKLPHDLAIWERRWLSTSLTELTERTFDGLQGETVRKWLPTLLRSPVPGTPEFPALVGNSEWSDPVVSLDERDMCWAKTEDISESVAGIIRQVLAVSDSPDEMPARKYLILRLVVLLCRRLLSSKHSRDFALALYASRDPSTGFPVHTGCLDSVVLLAPQVRGIDEHGMFVRKYVAVPWPEDPRELMNLLQSLAHTGPVIEHTSDRRLRGIRWTEGQLTEIAERCRDTVERQLPIIRSDRETMASRFGRFIGGTPAGHARGVIRDIADVVDDLLLNREIVPGRVWDPILAMILYAEQEGSPMLEAYPKLATFDPRFRRLMVDEIVSRLCGGEGERIGGFRALNHWVNQLADSRIPRIPDAIVSALVAHLQRDYGPTSIHALDTVRNLLFHLPRGKCAKLLNRCDSSLKRWSRQLTYSEKSLEDSSTDLREELPDLRESMTRLCAVAEWRGLSSNVVSEWLATVRDDPMPEIRRALSQPGNA